jgi:hypothetical protein
MTNPTINMKQPQPYSHPTTGHDGVHYRSKLESIQALFMNKLGFRYIYEPMIPLKGYLPDFIIPDWAEPLLVEVKPLITLAEAEDHIQKTVNSGWTGSFIIVGASLFPSMVGENVWGLMCRQEDGVWIQYTGHIFRCPRCSGVSVFYLSDRWTCCRCGKSSLRPIDINVNQTWIATKNETQWKAPASVWPNVISLAEEPSEQPIPLVKEPKNVLSPQLQKAAKLLDEQKKPSEIAVSLGISIATAVSYVNKIRSVRKVASVSSTAGLGL